MTEIFNVDIHQMTIAVLIVSLEVVGIVQWFKNFLKRKVDNKIPGKKLAISSLLFCVIFGLVQTSYVPSITTAIVNIVFLSLAVTQLAWDCIIKGLPKLVNGLFDKAIDLKSRQED